MAHEERADAAPSNHSRAVPEKPLDVLEARRWGIPPTNPALLGKLEQVKRLCRKHNRGDLLRRYDLGLALRDVYDDETDHGADRYGAHAVEKICRALGSADGSLVRHSLRLAQAYTRAEVERLAATRTASGGPVTWAHVRLLTQVDDRARRAGLLRRTTDESWTSDDLALKVKELLDGGSPSRSTSRGRPLAAPRDLGGALRQQAAAAGNFVQRSAEVWSDPAHSLQALVQALGPPELREWLPELEGHVRKLRRLEEEAGARRRGAEAGYAPGGREP